jgi:hypothetical protein
MLFKKTRRPDLRINAVRRTKLGRRAESGFLDQISVLFSNTPADDLTGLGQCLLGIYRISSYNLGPVVN